MAQRKRPIEFSRPDEPSFLKKMKAEMGMDNKPIETIETKKATLEKARTADVTDREDEQPVFVIPEDAKISEDELNQFKDKLKEDLVPTVAPLDPNQKILFRKPTKDGDTKGMQTVQSTVKARNQTDDKQEGGVKSQKSAKPVRNASLLSFNEDEEED